MQDKYSPLITRTLDCSGKELTFTYEELRELTEKTYEYLKEAEAQRIEVRSVKADPTAHGLIRMHEHNAHRPLETLLFRTEGGYGTWPYGAPLILFEHLAEPSAQLGVPDSRGEEQWRLTLSGATGLNFGTAPWWDEEAAHRLFARATTVTAEQLAVEASLMDTTVRWIDWTDNPSVDIDGFLSLIRDRDPLDLDDYATQLSSTHPDAKIGHLRLFDPRLLRYVVVPQVIAFHVSWNQLISDVDPIIKSVGLAPLRAVGNYAGPLTHGTHIRLAIARPQTAALRSITKRLLSVCSPHLDTPHKLEYTDPAVWHITRAVVNPTPLTLQEHAQALTANP